MKKLTQAEIDTVAANLIAAIATLCTASQCAIVKASLATEPSMKNGPAIIKWAIANQDLVW